MRLPLLFVLFPIAVAQPAAHSGLLITEVLANARDESGSPGSGEWVELLNAGPGEIDFGGWTISDGDQTDEVVAANPGGSTVLGPRRFALIIDPDRPRADAPWPRGTLLLTVDDRSIGNGLSPSDRLRIAPPLGGRAATYFEGEESEPPDPGRGLSMERVRLKVREKGRENWRPSRLVGGTPGALNSATLLNLHSKGAGAARWLWSSGEWGIASADWSAAWMAEAGSHSMGSEGSAAAARVSTAADGSARLSLRLGPDVEGRVLHLSLDLAEGSLLPALFGGQTTSAGEAPPRRPMAGSSPASSDRSPSPREAPPPS
ncbi:MAG: hypothetical protein CME06_06965 [Gemmatimonadetes bacterium]|nr:hypothetical protein [Gemmatimonadota bacterium]